MAKLLVKQSQNFVRAYFARIFRADLVRPKSSIKRNMKNIFNILLRETNMQCLVFTININIHGPQA